MFGFSVSFMAIAARFFCRGVLGFFGQLIAHVRMAFQAQQLLFFKYHPGDVAGVRVMASEALTTGKWHVS